MKAIRIHEHGGPDVLRYEDVETRSLAKGEVLVRNHAAGVNRTDIYARTGFLGEVSELPATLGKEGAGEVVAVGEGVTDFAAGDRVAYTETFGAYAEATVVPAHFLVHLPDAIDFDTAAASLLKGLTAQYLLRHTFRVEPSQAILYHGAAGGVGLILTQWAAHLGATVIGTVGSSKKVGLARANGCHHVIDNSREDFVARVKEITGGEGCHVVYDGVGKDTAQRSLDCLRPRGTYVNFGWASGPVDAISPMDLLSKGSLYMTAPSLTQYLDKREDVVANAQELFDVIESGAMKVRVFDRLPLDQAAEAHRVAEGRDVTGAIILHP
ncbi:quinone oxidoreductase [uncultured Sphingomonas sp.]|uniref:quinone oxidoreductase family protein n=1 Tax=uncultured Sphingomonas sp. TaxID=158754 RepID=UPI0025FD4910|nr:quinone oxidoreductase [uncultured Sphingomonas sp.]